MRRFLSFLLACLLLLSLTACGGSPAPSEDPDATEEETSAQETEEEPAPPEPEPYDIYDPTVMPEGGTRNGVTYAAYDGIVEHLFFHPVVAYPELAFDGDNQANGIDDYMVTVDEYNKILQSVYDKGYVLVDIADVWSEVTGEDGTSKMVRNTLYLPEGKKPLILSYDDVNYYEYMLTNGFTWKLILGEDGKIASYGKDPQGAEVVSRDLDAVPILDKFVEEHPDFSPFGAKGCLSLTGYEGILGYRTQTDTKSWTEAATPGATSAWAPSPWSPSRRTRSGGLTRLAAWWAPPPSSSTPTASGPTGRTGRTPARCSSTSRARASGCSPPWASRASATSRRTSARSSATGSTRTAPPCATPGTGTCNSMTQRILWM